MTHAATSPLPAPEGLSGSHLLPAGTRLDEFEILRPLGIGGFGIVYLAIDHSLLRQVALKEFMPADLAARDPAGAVGPRSEHCTAQFARGLESFFDEARLLAPFNHPALVRVHRFWKANGTAYMAMQYCPGQTLKEARSAMHAPPDEPWLRAFVEPLLGALERLHRAGVVHRDISPDNILLLPNGRPILLDFGSARRAVGTDSGSLTAVLKPNFAPIEQYGDDAAMAQGPWTDLYALGATVQFMLTGRAPTPAVIRVVKDTRTPLAAAGPSAFPGVGAAFLAAIDWTAAVAPNERPHSVAALRKALAHDGPATARLRTARPRLLAPTLALAAVGAVIAGAWTFGPMPTLATAAAATRASPVASPSVARAASASASVAAPARAPGSIAVVAALDPALPPVRRSEPPKRASPAVKWLPPAAPTSLGAMEKGTVTRHAPSEACAGRNFIARAMCVSEQCEAPGARMHPECVESRRIEEQRQRRMER